MHKYIKMKPAALKYYSKYKELGVVTDTPREIYADLMSQEGDMNERCISYATSAGCVTFDCADFEEIDRKALNRARLRLTPND